MQIYSVLRGENTSPILYYKGDQLLRMGYPFYLPSREERYVAYPALVVRIGKLGKEVQPRYAHRYIDALGVGWDLQQPEKLARLRLNGFPWQEAVAFAESSSATLSSSNAAVSGLSPFYTISYTCDGVPYKDPLIISEEEIREGIATFSACRLIKQGDLLFFLGKPIALLGDPHSSVSLQIGCDLHAFLYLSVGIEQGFSAFAEDLLRIR